MKKPRWRVSFRHRGVFYALGFCSCRVSFAFGDQLIQLDRSRSQTCTEPAAPILWPSGRILALRSFTALRADFGASRLYGPPGGFWRFAALQPSGRILALRGFMALRADLDFVIIPSIPGRVLPQDPVQVPDFRSGIPSRYTRDICRREQP